MAGLGGLGYGHYIEPHRIDVVQRPLPVTGLPSSLDGKVLAQISDLHVGPVVDTDYITRAVASVGQWRPDMVVITGDFMSCDGDEQLQNTYRVLEGLPQTELGIFAILGNHDYAEHFRAYDVANKLSAGLKDLNVRVLRNEVADVEGLQIAGIDDLYAGRARVGGTVKQVDYRRSCVALCHNPDLADDPGWGEFSGWILAGHTHGGQFCIPFIGPPVLPVRNKAYAAGEIALSAKRHMYINRGLGHLTQIRFNCPPEITVFTLAQA